ncbi:phage-related protein [Breznakibacter xylanolyticus]|uniref:Phage-related protein n=1 Tax=Breznakibacter xylanolyticus TaxID=990 RepID=A0A2W7NIV6_9BACT|nr:type II toxin-antitoxin system RelE/ParE family toxin [Breznakibacter xylanolyticus]PZX20335.1 phage-related protein [Breznakibacter xylanolyticus]
MRQKFEVILLEEVWDFLCTLDEKSREKILYNIDKSKYVNNPELFKKLDEEIWEFRTKYSKTYYRIFAFWDKTGNTKTLVIATHGIIKKTDKIHKGDIERTKTMMKLYFDNKQ